MSFEKYPFEEEGLKIDKDRVLTYSKLSCPMDCRYCFVDDLNFNQKNNVAYLSEKQWQLIEHLPEDVKLIMLGCDTEFFQSKKRSLAILTKLVELGRDISVITKLALKSDFIAELADINKSLTANGNLLAFSVSLPCFDSAQLWEPKAPAPEMRIETLKSAKTAGLMTMVAIRPLLPNISDNELEKIISLTVAYTDGYYSGPLYLKEFNEEIKSSLKMQGCEAKQIQPHWMPKENDFYKVEKPGQYETLIGILKRHNKPLFEGAAEGIKYFKSQI